MKSSPESLPPRLHSDKSDEATFATQLAGDLLWLDTSVGFVEGADFDFNVIAKHAALFAIERQAVEHSQSI